MCKEDIMFPFVVATLFTCPETWIPYDTVDANEVDVGSVMTVSLDVVDDDCSVDSGFA